MSAALRLARPEDLSKLLPLVADFHQHMGLDLTDEHRTTALTPLLTGSPHGAIYLIGPSMAPIGYVVISFGWSIEFGGLDGMLDEIYLRPSVRGRGIGQEVLSELPKALARAGLKALSLEVRRDDDAAQRFYTRLHFKTRDGYALMTRES